MNFSYQKASMAAVARALAAASMVAPDIEAPGASTGQSVQSRTMVNGLALAPVGTLYLSFDHFFHPD